MDGTALEVGENDGQIIQRLVKPLLAAVNVFALADVVGQVLQQDGRFLPVFLGDGAGKRVNLGWIGGSGWICGHVLSVTSRLRRVRFVPVRGYLDSSI